VEVSKKAPAEKQHAEAETPKSGGGEQVPGPEEPDGAQKAAEGKDPKFRKSYG